MSPNYLFLVFVFFIFSGVRAAPKKPRSEILTSNETCLMRHMHIPAMNPLVRKDENGKTCRIHLTTPVCRGYCRTYEHGTHVFPHRAQKSVICMHDGGHYEEIPMEECDEGADAKIRTIRVLKDSRCVCKACEKSRSKCMRNSLFK
ncbi:hypothetical protein AB6A40_001985 [Gnathostoma spinigerum]|uniref:Glycoprotein hormone subunit beta domain-containing protein n=1 Tax=Gnathostoma spinigerum TaxID=75299 RepID=A0ABD6E6Q9_9BILA